MWLYKRYYHADSPTVAYSQGYIWPQSHAKIKTDHYGIHYISLAKAPFDKIHRIILEFNKFPSKYFMNAFLMDYF